MGYYDNRVKATRMINDLLDRKVSMEVIIYNVSSRYGFGESFIKNRIKEMTDAKSATTATTSQSGEQ